jgi:cell division protein FtsB
MATLSSFDTQRLTRSDLELRSRGGWGRLLLSLAVVGVILGLALWAGVRGPNPPLGLLGQQDSLRKEVSRLQTELELEKATRLALTRQAADLQQQLNDLTQRMAFLNDPRAPKLPE